MNKNQIKKLFQKTSLPGNCGKPSLTETHISWVILCDDFAYKIKKPVQFSFVDFSTLALRKHFCEEELTLNQRLTNTYIAVLPVRQMDDTLYLGKGEGTVIDYAVQMKRMDNELEMDHQLEKESVTTRHIQEIANILAPFHRNAHTHKKRFSVSEFKNMFNDIAGVSEFLQKNGLEDSQTTIDRAMQWSNTFLDRYGAVFQQRINDGWLRDVHGDLHGANIFLTSPPVIFDCIEFKEEFRQIDLLEELAFFCMDLESYGAKDFSEEFMDCYEEKFKVLYSMEDELLFQYFKFYRANVKMKIQALKAQQSTSSKERKRKIKNVKQYFELMKSYLK